MKTDTTLAPASPSMATCQECQGRREGFQIYTVRQSNGTLLAWDVDFALHLCSDGRKRTLVHPVHVDEMLRVNRYCPEHLEHVDPDRPGIVCIFEYTDDSQPLFCLVDGSHRAARCQRDSLPFFVYVLTDEESLACQHTPLVALYRALHSN